ncbi:hypothetical protein [Marinilabilia sp.]
MNKKDLWWILRLGCQAKDCFLFIEAAPDAGRILKNPLIIFNGLKLELISFC